MTEKTKPNSSLDEQESIAKWQNAQTKARRDCPNENCTEEMAQTNEYRRGASLFEDYWCPYCKAEGSVEHGPDRGSKGHGVFTGVIR